MPQALATVDCKVQTEPAGEAPTGAHSLESTSLTFRISWHRRMPTVRDEAPDDDGGFEGVRACRRFAGGSVCTLQLDAC